MVIRRISENHSFITRIICLHFSKNISPLGPPRAKPSNFKVKSVTKTSITIQFEEVPPSDRPKTYVVELKNTILNISHTEILNSRLGNALPEEVEFSNLMAGVMYEVRVRAVNDAGNGQWTDIIQISTLIGML